MEILLLTSPITLSFIIFIVSLKVSHTKLNKYNTNSKFLKNITEIKVDGKTIQYTQKYALKNKIEIKVDGKTIQYIKKCPVFRGNFHVTEYKVGKNRNDTNKGIVSNYK